MCRRLLCSVIFTDLSCLLKSCSLFSVVFRYYQSTIKATMGYVVGTILPECLSRCPTLCIDYSFDKISIQWSKKNVNVWFQLSSY